MASFPLRPRREPDPNNGFTRTTTLIEYKAVVRSTCNYCGMQFSSNSAEVVWAEEMEHREHCPTVKRPSGPTSAGET